MCALVNYETFNILFKSGSKSISYKRLCTISLSVLKSPPFFFSLLGRFGIVESRLWIVRCIREIAAFLQDRTICFEYFPNCSECFFLVWILLRHNNLFVVHGLICGHPAFQFFTIFYGHRWIVASCLFYIREIIVSIIARDSYFIQHSVLEVSVLLSNPLGIVTPFIGQ